MIIDRKTPTTNRKIFEFVKVMKNIIINVCYILVSMSNVILLFNKILTPAILTYIPYSLV